MRANDPRGKGQWQRVGAYAAICLATAAIVLPLWWSNVEPNLQQIGGRSRGPGLSPLPFVVAIVLATAVFRLLGLSLAGKTVETRRRVGGGKPGGEIDAVVEIDYPGVLHRPPIAVLPFTLFVLSILLIIVPPPPSGVPSGAAGVVAFGALTLLCLNLFRNPILRLDAEGVLGYPSEGLGFRRRFVPWSGIASCSIETRHDDFGGATGLALTFADSHGSPRLGLKIKIPSRTLPATDLRWVEEFLAAKFPKHESGVPGEL